MDVSTIASISISIISLLTSLFVAYRTLVQGFIGKIWPAQAIVLTHLDEIPALGLACYVENKGAQAGYLEDIRLIVKHVESGSRYFFYPLLTRNDYSIFESYTTKDWYPFSGFYLLPKDQGNKYLLFKPLNDHFSGQSGKYQIDLEVRWQSSKKWISISDNINIEISTQLATKWSDPQSSAYQVYSSHVLDKRVE